MADDRGPTKFFSVEVTGSAMVEERVAFLNVVLGASLPPGTAIGDCAGCSMSWAIGAPRVPFAKKRFAKGEIAIPSGSR